MGGGAAKRGLGTGGRHAQILLQWRMCQDSDTAPERLNPKPQTLTQVADKNMLHEVDAITTQILAAIQKSQADGAAGT